MSLTAAIRGDKRADLTLDKITAADLLDVVSKTNSFAALAVFPEKKKFELEVEPGFGGMKFRDLATILDRFRGDKKKVELEVPWYKNLGGDPWNAGLSDMAARLDALSSRIDDIAKK